MNANWEINYMYKSTRTLDALETVPVQLEMLQCYKARASLVQKVGLRGNTLGLVTSKKGLDECKQRKRIHVEVDQDT